MNQLIMKKPNNFPQTTFFQQLSLNHEMPDRPLRECHCPQMCFLVRTIGSNLASTCRLVLDRNIWFGLVLFGGVLDKLA